MYLENLVLDAVDPSRVGPFWEQALGARRLTTSPEGLETRLVVPGGPTLDVCVQRVPQPPTEHVRLHPDLLGGAARDDVVARLLDLGACHLDIGQGDVPWVVLGDPEGNPFCVMEEREVYADTGPIAALPLDSADPDRDVVLWSWLTGWSPGAGAAPQALRHPSGRGPWLELLPESSPGVAGSKNRWHLDIRLEAGDDADQVVAGIEERGGGELHPDWGDLPWRVFADPSGNEFCVLPART